MWWFGSRMGTNGRSRSTSVRRALRPSSLRKGESVLAGGLHRVQREVGRANERVRVVCITGKDCSSAGATKAVAPQLAREPADQKTSVSVCNVREDDEKLVAGEAPDEVTFARGERKRCRDLG